MSQLDRLERMGLVLRRNDPHDRRRRIPEITETGHALRERVAEACADVETVALSGLTQEQGRTFRRTLVDIIGNSEDPGSCL
jgi:MarR family transcriptional regulator, organic hydroperoxide resistance regulator